MPRCGCALMRTMICQNSLMSRNNHQPTKHTVDPTAHKPKGFLRTYRLKNVINKILRVIWYVVLACILFQVVLFGIRILHTPPSERPCWDRWMCFNYCATGKQKVCLLPPDATTPTIQQSWHLIMTGKRTVIEVLHDNQRYCACQVLTGDDETRTETFYKYYTEHR